LIINKVTKVKGTLKVPGDKSISHRSVMIGALAKGTTHVKGFLMGADCLSTIACFRQMGIQVELQNDCVTIVGKGLHGLTKPMDILDAGNSGTTIRIISGILSGQNFSCKITGDHTIQKRPMARIIEPLTMMGANIKSVLGNNMAPLEIVGGPLSNIDYISKVASAQVKSSIMLASLYTEGTSTILEPHTSRNHTEIMLNVFGANVETKGTKVIVNPVKELYASEVIVPSDISSAAYFMVAALILKDSEVKLLDVGINPTRDGIIKVLQAMNGNIELDNIRTINGEKTADIIIKSSQLTGTIIEKEIIPTLIDEIPAIAIAASVADGQTIIKDAAELKVKETNRIDAMVTELTKMGADIIGTDDGMIITGVPELKGATVDTYHDHRIAMSLSIAGLIANSPTTINGSDCINISYPNFFEDLKQLTF
jgi:3-phosphoshikimate 1-carboxyvinyltransferase